MIYVYSICGICIILYYVQSALEKHITDNNFRDFLGQSNIILV